MKQLFTLFLSFLLLGSGTIIAQTVERTQSFEGAPTDNWNFNTNPVQFNAGSDIWDVVSSLNNVNMPTDGFNFFGIQDLANGNGGTVTGDSGMIQFDSIQLDPNADNILLEFDYDVFEYDAGDYFYYHIYTDGNLFVEDTLVSGMNNGGVSAVGTVSQIIPNGTDSVRLTVFVVQNGGSDYAGLDNVNLSYDIASAGDITPPEVSGFSVVSATEIHIAFTEGVTQNSAENTGNYTITPGINVSGATQNALDSVILTLGSGLSSGVAYNLDISNVVDTSSNGNILVPFSDEFLFNDYSGSDLVITEIFYNEPNSGDLEYIELYNKGGMPIELGGLEITDGFSFVFEMPYALASGEFIVLVSDSTDFNNVFSVPLTHQFEWESGSLSNGGETLEISNSLGTVVHAVEYDDRTPWDPRPDGDGYALILCDVTSDNGIPSNWSVTDNVAGNDGNQDLFGSPAAANTCAAFPIYEIGTITTVDTAGSADSLGVFCTIQGLVAAPNFSADGEGGPDIEFQVINETNTEGILAISFATTGEIGYDPILGDEVRINGVVGQFNGVAQFDILSVEVLSTANCMPFPQMVDVPMEMHESELIELRNVSFVDNSWISPAGDGRNYEVVTPNDDTVLVRIRDLTDIDSAFVVNAQSNFNLIGLGSEFQGTYQVWPRSQADFDFDLVKPAPAGLVINELMADNETVFQDGAGEYDDWIELYNDGFIDVDVAGMFVTDDPQNPMKYRIPNCANTTIPSGGFLIIWADEQPEQGALHTNFSLDASGEFVGLYTPDGMTVADSISFGAQTVDHSYGRRGDALADWVVFETTTPDASNNSGVVLSIADAQNNTSNLRVYPNPTQGVVFFSELRTVQVFGLNGQLIDQQTNVNTLDLSSFEQGVYIIRTNQSEVYRVIKR